MAKKRDRQGTGSTDRAAGRHEHAAAEEGMSFAEDRYPMHMSEGDIEAWEDEQKTAPDLFADASDEDQMRAGGGHTQPRDEEPRGQEERPPIRRR